MAIEGQIRKGGCEGTRFAPWQRKTDPMPKGQQNGITMIFSGAEIWLWQARRPQQSC